MKAKVLPDNLKAGLKWVKPAMAKNTALPVLENVLIEATWQGVRLTATDLDLAASACIGGKIEKPGRITVPFKALETLAKTLPNKPLEMCAKRKGHLTLTQDSKNIMLETIDAQEFPLTRTAKGKTYKALDTLQDACRFVEHAICTDGCRPSLEYAQAKGGKLWAADGYRLTIAPGFNGEGSFPRSLVNFLARAKEEPTKLTLDDTFITVWFGDNWVSAKQYDGQFPDWEQVIPKANWSIAVDFARFLEKVQLIASLKPNGKIVILEPKRGRLYLEANAEGIAIKDWLRASCEGKRERVGFNALYVLDTLHPRKPLIKEGWLKISGGTGSEGIVFADQHTPFVEVIMPMHISR